MVLVLVLRRRRQWTFLQCSRLQKTSRIRVWEEVKKLQRLGSLRCAAFRRMLRRNRLDALPRDALYLGGIVLAGKTHQLRSSCVEDRMTGSAVRRHQCTIRRTYPVFRGRARDSFGAGRWQAKVKLRGGLTM
jgi:hypothetical protein